MPLYGGTWYADWGGEDACPCAADAYSGLVVPPPVLEKLCASAAGAPVTWEHSAVPAVREALAGTERQAAIDHGQTAGSVKASWICKNTGHAHVVFEIPDSLPMVCAMIDAKILQYLSATHIVGSTEMIELSLTTAPARPGCNIESRVSSITEYITLHPP
ncbi:MAG: hypothetical protein CL678_00680 [Bdellovibrionaceae bacterium]|nr:hypothetical protein [Pseudobdellovibrionaceae bacterium]